MKIYSNKSNAQRAAKKIEGATVEAVQGGWAVRTRIALPVHSVGAINLHSRGVAPKQLNETTYLLTADDGEYGLVRDLDDARLQAQQLANDDGLTISVRDVTTDEIVATFEPTQPTLTVVEAPEAADIEAQEPAMEQGDEETILMQIRVYVGAEHATKIALKVARLVGNPATIHTTNGKLVQTIQPNEPKAAKAKAPKTERTERASKDKPEAGSMAEQIISMCLREQGATPTELNDLTNWKGAPWKWTLSNPKGTGLADRYGYDLTVSKDGRASTYFLTRKEDRLNTAA